MEVHEDIRIHPLTSGLFLDREVSIELEVYHLSESLLLLMISYPQIKVYVYSRGTSITLHLSLTGGILSADQGVCV